MTDDNRGWHNDSYEHDLARQGVKTRKPGITEEDAEKIVAGLKGQSTSHSSQSKAQMPWYDEHWLQGEFLPQNKIDELDVEDIQKIRKVCEENRDKAKSAGNDHHAYFYEKQRDKLKEMIGEKLRTQMKDIEKQRNELGGF